MPAMPVPVPALSLRRRLLLLLLGGGAGFVLLLGMVSWWLTHHEIDELYDAQLRQLAQSLLLANQAARASGQPPAPSPIAGLTDDPPRFLFQIRDAHGQLLAQSPNTPATPLTLHDGFSEVENGQAHWRYFSQWDNQHHHQVQIGENHVWRDRLIRENVLQLLWPFLLAVPLLAFWLWHATRRGLLPLDLLARQIDVLRVKGFPASPEIPAYGLPVVAVPQEAVPLVTAIQHLLQQVETTLALERRFTADAAHELRTPLAALRTQLQVARRARDAAERDHALHHLQQGLDRTARLVEQMLLLARLDPERGLPDASGVDLARLAQTVCAELGNAALARQQELSLEAEAGVYCHGQADWLHGLLRNLLENAIRYTPAGGQIHVSVHSSPAEPGGQTCCLTVTDNGPGIPPAERQRVFQRFYRLPAAAQDAAGWPGGSGLGLSIVARIAELHRATLRLDAPPNGQGLRVQACFPPEATAPVPPVR